MEARMPNMEASKTNTTRSAAEISTPRPAAAGAPQGSARLEEIAGAAENPEDIVIRRERRRVVRELMSELHPDQREALLLKYVEGLSAAEVAVTMHRSPAAVNSLLQRARAILF